MAGAHHTRSSDPVEDFLCRNAVALSPSHLHSVDCKLISVTESPHVAHHSRLGLCAEANRKITQAISKDMYMRCSSGKQQMKINGDGG